MIYCILILSLIGLIYGANILINGSSELAHRFNISNFIIGALIVGIGTSMPEFVVSLSASIQNNADIAIGNIVGSNIFNVLGIIGISAIIFPIAIKSENVKFDIPICIFISIILTILVFNSENIELIWYEGIILLLIFFIYIWYSLKNNNSNDIQINIEPLWKSICKIIFGLIALITCCSYFVDISIIIAKNLGLSNAVIGLTLVACGTSLPELAASVIAAFKKNADMAIGNIIGSNIFNIAFILGICSLTNNLSSPDITLIDYFIMIFSTFILLICAKYKKITRLTGVLMLLSFIFYLIYLCN